MALIAEEVVEEWLNRQGFFTIRGIKLGNHEIDILAIRPKRSGKPECRHVEVQVSVNPISYISSLPKRTGRGPNSAKWRPTAKLIKSVKGWIQKKFDLPKKQEMRQALCPAEWTRELVVGAVRYREELELMESSGILVTHFDDVLVELRNQQSRIAGAAGKDLLDLISIGAPRRF